MYWTGPDPPHHFSVAVRLCFLLCSSTDTPTQQIVPIACAHLFTRATYWTSLRTLHITNIAFPHSPYEFAFPALSALEVLYIGQATFLPVRALAVFVCASGMHRLHQVRLVDCYVESIWGGR